MPTALVLVLVLGGATGCALSGLSPIPDLRSPADRAHDLDPKCHGESEEAAASILAPTAVESVEPYTTSLPSPSGHDVRMLGAKLHVRPLPALTKEMLARSLQCHEARVVLGLSQPLPDDPYVLPGDWLTIDVDSDGNGFSVAAYPVDFKNGKEVLERARRFKP